ncbi:choice-of-anchor M domain-containing protein [Corynebacterium gerontici]|uniref:ABC transporter-associated repeat protein n=1 Tax=Corynebacterium gerontici TaxID=2079234 RepID=A0A3G6IXW6_9CORY|nr:choice-of-anchor M domain-containing protein [Corynebacterium gerontici]AZA10609.1 hypothetical protein CGERO_01375 [Corynebacterium gerontici]
MAVFKALLRCLSAVILLLAVASPASAQELNDPVVLDSGHVDAFNVTSDGQSLNLNLKEDVTGQHVERAPESATLRVKPEAFHDKIPGLDLPGYLLPLSQDPNLIWPGWDTMGVAAAGLGSIDIRFDSVSGPGRVFLFTQSGLGGGIEPLLNDGLELHSGSVRTQPEPAHTHAYWVFEAPGTYTMEVSAHQTGGGLSSQVRTYTWEVGDGTNPAVVPPPADVEKPETAAEAPVCTPSLVPMIRDDRTSPGQWRNPSELSFGLGPAAATAAQQAIGSIPAGTKVWAIGSVQQQGVPWLGANTMAESLIEKSTGAVTYEIVGFHGPGTMEVLVPGGLDRDQGTPWFHGDPGGFSGSVEIPANSHVHPSWVFDTEGTYEVSIRQTATLLNGEQVSGEAALTFIVGGQGNADEGHFDFGAQIDESCGATEAPAAEPAPPASPTTSRGTLANTAGGPLTGAIFILGAAWLLLGGSVIFANRKR